MGNSKNELMELVNKHGGWPVLKGNSWNEKEFDWKKVTSELLKEGFTDSIIEIFFQPGRRNDAKNEILVSSYFFNLLAILTIYFCLYLLNNKLFSLVHRSLISMTIVKNSENIFVAL